MIVRVSWILRIGAAMEFIGHGALGIFHLADSWTSYFAVVGIPRDAALALMPLVGLFDVAMAVTILFFPFRSLILYMTAWGLWTALLRPLAGESTWEAVERAGNFGALFALFLITKSGDLKPWLSFKLVDALSGKLLSQVTWALRLTTATLLLGHGALGLVHKQALSVQYAQIGLHSAWIEALIGGWECLLALAVLAWPTFWVFFFVVVWKLATEALSPLAGSPIWVFVEHGGSYAAPLALVLLSRGSGNTPSPRSFCRPTNRDAVEV